jgi:hypothetical protein
LKALSEGAQAPAGGVRRAKGMRAKAFGSLFVCARKWIREARRFFERAARAAEGGGGGGKWAS